MCCFRFFSVLPLSGFEVVLFVFRPVMPVITSSVLLWFSISITAGVPPMQVWRSTHER
jgi:hypothetical protein